MLLSALRVPANRLQSVLRTQRVGNGSVGRVNAIEAEVGAVLELKTIRSSLRERALLLNAQSSF